MTLKADEPDDGVLKDTASHIDAGHKYAPDEAEILDTGVTYIHIANESIHGDRLIMNKLHETYLIDGQNLGNSIGISLYFNPHPAAPQMKYDGNCPKPGFALEEKDQLNKGRAG